MNQSAFPALRIRVILVRPEDPRNVGAVVRAAANFRAESVHVVRETGSWGAEEERQAQIASSRSWDLMGGVRVHASIGEAATSCGILIGTSARTRRGATEAVTPAELFQEPGLAELGLLALVLGPESQGLSASELALCHRWIRIPTNPEFPSLNLAQAALLVLYQAFMAAQKLRAATIAPAPAAAPFAEQEWLLESLRQCLTAGGAGSPALDRQMGQLRSLLHRAQPTRDELSLLYGITAKLCNERNSSRRTD